MQDYALGWRLGVSVAVVMLVQWPESAFAIGAVGSASPTQVVVSYQHPGETAQTSSSRFGGKKYRICVEFQDGTEPCLNTDRQSEKLESFVVGDRYRIKVYCHCKGGGRFAIASTKYILDMIWRHTAPAPPTPPQVVRFRSAKSGLCLMSGPDGPVRSIACGPNSNQKFAIEPTANGTQLRHVDDGRCIFGGYPHSSLIFLAPCGTFGTKIWVMNALGGTSRLNIGSTEGPNGLGGTARIVVGCLLPSGTAGGWATRNTECSYGWNMDDAFFLDPA